MSEQANNSHIKVVSGKLQKEVDLILRDVDEKTLFAEFRQEEIFDIQNGDRRELVRHTLDERIFQTNLKSKRTRVEMSGHIKKNRPKGKVAKLVHYLFKPLEL